MAPREYDPNNPAMPQSIPLQDLSRPPDSTARGGGEDRIRQPISGRARALLGNRQGFSGRVNTSGRYERILAQEGSSSSRLDVPHITTPRNAHQPTTFYDDSEMSPVDVGEFQAAMGSVGLSFDNLEPERPSIVTTTSASGKTQLSVISETDGVSPFTRTITESADEDEDCFSPQDTDRSPLTDQRFLQPISGSSLPNAPSQRHDRHSQQSVRSSPGSMLGDDLPHVEHGLQVPGSDRSLRRLSSQSTRSLTRSISSSAAASPLSAAGNIFRKMSQRVVNLSNEPEILEQIGRQPSIKSATLEGPPSFPAMTEYAHDEPLDTPLPPVEKSEPLIAVRKPKETWQPPSNPLKGKSLKIFASDSRIRRWLCEVLVHPVTEPCILFLILFQTIILVVDGALEYSERPERWMAPWIDASMLFLFIIYTLEIATKIIVSGFIVNPEEKEIGFWKAIYEQCMNLFIPPRHRQIQGAESAVMPDTPDAQPSIIRSFTSNKLQPDQPGHSRAAQRSRLARRAFLRHSWDRLDFLAIVSFWISFLLSMLQLQSSRHIYLFQMLSCLRILRLLSLTSGTSVNICFAPRFRTY